MVLRMCDRAAAVSKPGECPRAAVDENSVQIGARRCTVQCRRDKDCAGAAKCCTDGCSRTCVEQRIGF